MNLTIPADLLERMIRHAQAVYPVEACGIVIGRGLNGSRFLPLHNVLASETAYEIDPSVLASTFRSLRETGEELVAIVHSHPRSPAEPSERDLDLALSGSGSPDHLTKRPGTAPDPCLPHYRWRSV